MHADWGMAFTQVRVGPRINHTCPNLSIEGDLGEESLQG